MVFGGCLLFFGWGFYNRKKFVCELEDTKLERHLEKYNKAEAFKREVEEGVRKRRAIRKAEKNIKEVRLL